MKTTLIWKKRLFKKTYEIYSNNSPIGKLSENIWSNSAEGEINNKKYQFKTQGFFKQKTQIIDKESNSVIGTIVYNTFGKIEFDQPNDLLALTGLYVTNYYWQMSVVTLSIILIILTPTWM